MYDKNYYQEKKLDIQKEYNELVFETYNEIERLVVKKATKVQELQAKLKKIEEEEKVSIEATKKAEETANGEPAKS